MKKATLILAALAFGLHFRASAQQPDAVYRLLRHEWTLNADGTSDYRYRHEVQILRNRALTAYADKGETFVVYNPDIEEVTVNEVYTIQLDGSRVDMPQNAFIHQLPAECADCARFNHLRELTMVHTGMEIGCIVVVDYTVHRNYNLLYESIPLLKESPVERFEISVSAPIGMDVRRSLLGEEYLPSGVTKSDVMRDKVVMLNLPEAPREPNMPEYIVPVLRLFNGSPEYVPAIGEERFGDAEEAMGQVMLGSDKEKVVAARNFVIDNIHLNDIHPRHLGYTRSTAAEVWWSGCGTATDKAVLLSAILHNEGYESRVGGEMSDEVYVYVDTLEYRLDVRRKLPLELVGEARDEVIVRTVKEDVDARVDTLEGGFYRLSLPVPAVGLPSAKSLTTQRTTPLQTTACDVSTEMRYKLPTGLKLMGGERNDVLEYLGVGRVEVSLRQSGREVRVVRNIRIESGMISVADYERFHRLMSVWYSVGEVVLRGK